MGNSGGQHGAQLIFIFRRHDHHIGKAAQIGKIEKPVMGRTVLTDNPAPVDGKHHRQRFEADIMKDLIVSPLKKCRIYGYHGFEAFGGHTGGECDAMLFGNADIEKPIGIGLGKLNEPGAFGHGGGDGYNFFVGFGQLEHGLAEYLGIARRRRFAAVAGARLDFETSDPVKMHRIFFRRRIPFAFDGGDMQQHRLFEHFDIVEDIDEMIQLVTIDGPEIFEAEGLE